MLTRMQRNYHYLSLTDKEMNVHRNQSIAQFAQWLSMELLSKPRSSYSKVHVFCVRPSSQAPKINKRFQWKEESHWRQNKYTHSFTCNNLKLKASIKSLCRSKRSVSKKVNTKNKDIISVNYEKDHLSQEIK